MGKVYLVGAGPGDPDLLTVKALRLIQQANVILYDRLVGEQILAGVQPECTLVYVGKRDGLHSLPQHEINALLVRYAYQHEIVVRLKGGDPFVFGRGGEEGQYLQRYQIPYEIVPGITSAIAVAAYAGIPVTMRGIAASFTVISGHSCSEKQQSEISWLTVATIDTLVFLMAVKNRQGIAQRLITYGRNPEEPVAFIEKGTTSQQQVKITTLHELATQNQLVIKSPAVMVVGEVVRCREHLNWFEAQTHSVPLTAV